MSVAVMGFYVCFYQLTCTLIYELGSAVSLVFLIWTKLQMNHLMWQATVSSPNVLWVLSNNTSGLLWTWTEGHFDVFCQWGTQSHHNIIVVHHVASWRNQNINKQCTKFRIAGFFWILLSLKPLFSVLLSFLTLCMLAASYCPPLYDV